MGGLVVGELVPRGEYRFEDDVERIVRTRLPAAGKALRNT